MRNLSFYSTFLSSGDRNFFPNLIGSKRSLNPEEFPLNSEQDSPEQGEMG
jgi:hypothetical protein